MATEDEGRGGLPSGAIVSLEEQDKGQWNKPSVFLLRAVPRAPTTRAALTASLSAGEMSWRDLDIAEPLLRLKVAMLDQMLPTPRVELEVVDEDEPEAGGRDGDYYESYDDLGVHELMLRDRPRMVAYYDSIMRNAAFIQGKVVLDVGCGTGVLAMMAARAGAKTVFAVEASGIASHAAVLVSHNGLGDIVKVINKRIEDVELPHKVDVIISEWMGFYLLHESMLNSVLDARDKWLKEDGLMLPSEAVIYACPVSMDQYKKDKVDFWADVCGLDLTPFGQTVADAASVFGPRPVVECLDSSQLLAEPQEVARFDCHTVKAEELCSLESNHAFKLTTAGNLAGFALWFDCLFEVRTNNRGGAAGRRKRARDSASESCAVEVGVAGVPEQGRVVLSTSPESDDTHWKQTVCMLGVYAPVGVGEEVEVHVAMHQDAENPRIYSISVQT